METRQDLPSAGVKALFDEAWELALKGELPGPYGKCALPPEFAADEEPNALKTEGEALSVRYLDEACPQIDPAAVELPVRGTIGGAQVRGFIDLLDTSGRVIDLKVTKRTPSEVSPDHRLQIATYRKLCPQATGAARVDSLVKNKKPKLVEQAYIVEDCDLVEIERMYPLVQQAIRAGVFLPNRGNFMCSRRYCAFWRACQREFGGRVTE